MAKHFLLLIPNLLLGFIPVCAMPSPDPNETARLATYGCEQETGLPASVVRTFRIGWGANAGDCTWLLLQATKANGEQFRIWFLTEGYPPDTLAAATKRVRRIILQRGTLTPVEFREADSGGAVLPSVGGWRYLLPRPVEPGETFAPKENFPRRVEYLGHSYRRASDEEPLTVATPPEAPVIELRPQVLVGVPSNTRQEDETRRYAGSDYKLRRLMRADFREMADAGINCVRVDAEQRGWVEDVGMFYWGPGGQDLPYPECLYDSRYLGPALFLDEPAVHTRDGVIRPQLAKDRSFGKHLTVGIVLKEFRDTFNQTLREGPSTTLLRGLAARSDVALGNMNFRQANLFSWETMVSTAAYQLSQDPQVPSAIVFEPPGRVGALRTLPEFDMTYGCQIPVDDPKNFADIIYGFLRGAARLTGKEWGTSIYGAVDRADAPWFLTHAYDLGATRFFFWDNAGLACVPYHECLGLARQLKMRVENRPQRDLDQLRNAAEVLILLPPGYNLGHVHLGRGNLWGLGELNLERKNQSGVKYREVMANFFTEIERCLRLGVAFDLLWDLGGTLPSGYREIVRVRENGKVEITEDGKQIVFDHARMPARPAGLPPSLEVALSSTEGAVPLQVNARARVTQTSAPVYYTLGTDNTGIYHNAVVQWELYGPAEEDYRFLSGFKPRMTSTGKKLEVTIDFRLSQPGSYRLRAAVVDMAGRSTVQWTPITVTE